MSKVRKFNIGQIVQWNPKPRKDSFFIDSYAVIAGATGKIVSLEKMPKYLEIKWIPNSLSRWQQNGAYFPNDFNIRHRALKPLLKKSLKKGQITNLEYLELLAENNKKNNP